VAAHTGRQLDEPGEVQWAHVSADRLATLDGRSLDDGTPDAVAGTVDVEDYALLLELHRRKTGALATRHGERARYAHVVLDEAQELSPVELRVLGQAVAPEGGSVTVAGDAAQRIDRSGHFASWEAVMEAILGTRAHQTRAALLTTSYRCPRPIVELAQHVLGPEAPAVMPRAAREGPTARQTIVPSEGHAAIAIARGLVLLRDREPGASVAVLARDAEAARALFAIVSRALPARLVEDGAFSFGPGVEITEVAEAKGLEFDYVVVPDASARAYPSTPEHRRTLHVAVTRAARQVWIVSPGVPSPILPQGHGGR
jgi:DNA helicase IV